MPEGQLITTEHRVAASPDDAHQKTLKGLSPALQQAKYRLISNDAQSITYERKYLPSTAMALALLALLAAIFVNSTAPSPDTRFIVLGWAAVAVLAFYRRRESLSVTFEGTDEGSRIVVAGNVSTKGRAALAWLDEMAPARTSKPSPTQAP